MNNGQLFGVLSCKRLSWQPNRGLGSRFACVPLAISFICLFIDDILTFRSLSC